MEANQMRFSIFSSTPLSSHLNFGTLAVTGHCLEMMKINETKTVNFSVKIGPLLLNDQA